MFNFPVSIAYKIIGALILVIFGFVLYEYGIHVGELRTEAKDAIELNKAIAKNDKLKQELEVQHEQANRAIDTVLSIKPPRVQLPKISCPNTSTGGQVSVNDIDVLLGRTEEILARDRQRTWELWGKAEKELNDCNIVKKWAASLK